MITVIPVTGNESDDDCKQIAWEMFCNAHPIEAYRHDPERFWQFFHPLRPDMSREQLESLVCRLEMENPQE